MRISLSVLIALLISSTLLSQVVYQQSSARELNSNRKPLEGVFVKFENAGSTNSDSKGFIQIAFQDKKAGDLIFLEDIKKSGYEIVNKKEFEVMKISSGKNLGADIIMAKKGVIDAAKKKYYGLSDKALLAGFEKEKKALRAKLKSAQVKQDEYLEQLEVIQEQYEQQKESLDALASKFARINFDDVDPIYQKALELFNNGKISEAITILEGANPTARTAQIIKEEKRLVQAQVDLDQQKKQLAVEKKKQIATIQLLADMYNLNFALAKAEFQYDQLLLLDSTNLEILIKAATFYRDQHLYTKSKNIFSKIIEHPETDSARLALSYRHLGLLNTQTGDYTLALESLEKSHLLFQVLHQQKESIPYFQKELVIAKHELGKLQSKTFGKVEEAIVHQKAALKIAQQLNDSYSENLLYQTILSNSYQNLGEIYQIQGDFYQALDFYKKFNRLQNDYSEVNPEDIVTKDALAVSYDKLGSVYSILDSLQQALEAYTQASQIAQELFEANPKSVYFKKGLAMSYAKMGQANSFLGNLDSTLTYFQKNYLLTVELSASYPDNVNFQLGLTSATGALGDTYSAMGDFEKALDFYKKEIDLSENLYTASPQNINFKNSFATSNALLGIFYRDQLKDSVKAKEHLKKAEKIYKELTVEAPQVSQFQNFLQMVEEEIKKIED